MTDFHYFTPTEIAFGKSSEEKLTFLLKKHGAHNVLIHYGGGSAERSGLLGKIRLMLKNEGIPFCELGGVVPNPRLSLVKKGIDLCREEGVDFILAVGGGSVIDSSKCIGYGVPYEGDVWDFFDSKAVPHAAVPVGVVLTIPASGSEMSDSTVITNDGLDLKRGCNSDICRPRFAIMNPERTFTLPSYQTACGITDILMHTLERYFSKEHLGITDAVAEGLLRTVMDAGPKVLKDPFNYELRASIMWAGSLSHNGLTGCGAVSDFGTHRLEHELSTMFGVAHGAGLAALWCYWAEYVREEDPSRFDTFSRNVLDGKDAIEGMRDFFHSIGMPTSIPELIGRKATQQEIETMALRCSRGGSFKVGNFKVLGQKEMLEIYNMSNK
ncbi:MAG: iron-containing alcohol dehydrogenase [Bacteroidales bacterium]|nr:iron-containing alcohol dehydrogenase [Bacteroidales bacterium]